MAIYLPFKKLTQWQQIACCAALLERMLPNYQMFAQAAQFGDFQVLRNQLDIIWQRLDKSQKVKINYDAQLAKLEVQIPDPEAFQFFGVYPALDAAMALMSLLQTMQDNEQEGFASISRLSENSVHFYIELMLAEQAADDELITEESIKQHPLMQWEIATQNEVFDFLQASPETKKTCQMVKQMVLEQGLSNLGIEI